MAIITLTKGTFSGAGELARGISERLGYKLVSREDLIERAARYGLSSDRLDRARRRQLGILQRMDLGWRHYLVFARAALSKEIRQGDLVYIGDEGQELLHDFPNVLRVQVVADMDHRVDNFVRRVDYVVSRRKAKRLIAKIDEKKLRWRKALYDEGHEGTAAFDLVIDPELAGSPEAFEIVGATLQRPEFQTTPKKLETIELLTIAADLRARIAMNAEVVDDDVEIGVQGGAIVIEGSVPSGEDMEAIRALLY